jgi:hypothetical protein
MMTKNGGIRFKKMALFPWISAAEGAQAERARISPCPAGVQLGCGERAEYRAAYPNDRYWHEILRFAQNDNKSPRGSVILSEAKNLMPVTPASPPTGQFSDHAAAPVNAQRAADGRTQPPFSFFSQTLRMREGP